MYDFSRIPRDMNVNIQYQTMQPLDLFFIKALTSPTNLTADVVLNDLVVSVTSTDGMSVGDYLGIFSGGTAERFYFGEILSIAVNDITIDSPIDFAFQSDTAQAVAFTRELNINGDITPQTYVVRGPGTGDNFKIEITRLMLFMITNTAPESSDFGDIDGGLIKGIIVRRNNGTINNIFNAKTNAELDNLMFNFQTFDPANPAGVNGIKGRFTFAGQDKHGVAIKLAAGESIDLIIQDDLTSLLSFRMIAEGRIVQP